MTSPVLIREGTEADAARIAEILQLAFAEFRSLYTPAAFQATTPGPEAIVTRMREGPCWIALQDEMTIGTVSAVQRSPDCYVRGMGVLPDSRARGVGWQLLRAAERFALEAGSRRVYLSTTPFLDRAIRMYERFGFRRDSEGSHDLFGTPLFTMMKEVDRAS